MVPKFENSGGYKAFFQLEIRKLSKKIKSSVLSFQAP